MNKITEHKLELELKLKLELEIEKDIIGLYTDTDISSQSYLNKDNKNYKEFFEDIKNEFKKETDDGMNITKDTQKTKKTKEYIHTEMLKSSNNSNKQNINNYMNYSSYSYESDYTSLYNNSYYKIISNKFNLTNKDKQYINIYGKEAYEMCNLYF